MKHKRFNDTDIGISGIVPEGWVKTKPGHWLRRAFETDATQFVQLRVGDLSIDEVLALGLSPCLHDELPEHVGMIEGPNLIWNWYRGPALESASKVVDIALSKHENWVYAVVLEATPGEIGDLHETVFLPVVKALAPATLDPELARQLEAHAEEYRQMTRANRDALRNGPWPDFPTQSDQQQGLPIPVPQQPYDVRAQLIELPAPDRTILTKPDLFACMTDRRSRRKYTNESLTIQELAFLLWATQGVRQILAQGRGSYRTVPSGGSLHPFETYLAVNRVDGLAPGVYRYLPFQHRLVFLFPVEDLSHKLVELMHQPFVGQAAVCFVWSAVPYRSEWRYGLKAIKDILMEVGHVCQNLYLACESICCGTCAILGYHQDTIDAFLGLDEEEEMVIYLAPVGRVEGA